MAAENKKISVDTKDLDDPPSLGTQPTKSLSSSGSEDDVREPLNSDDLPPVIPTNQPVRMSRLELENKVKEFVSKIGLNWEKLSGEQQLTAKRLMSPDFTSSPTKHRNNSRKQCHETTFSKEWEKFLVELEGEHEQHKEALSNFENLFFDEDAMATYMVIRRQISKLCCAHASVLLQHYIVSKFRDPKEKANLEMLDISSFIRDDLEVEKQKKYIEKGAIGCNSFDLLRRFTGTEEDHYYVITPSRKEDRMQKFEKDVNEIHDTFKSEGIPGLIAKFKFDPEAFHNSKVLEGPMDRKQWDENKKKSQNRGSLHAMVLIGAYELEGRYWFVLQNFHEGSYFRIVDGEYLASGGTTVYFPQAKYVPEMKLQDSYKRVEGQYCETAFALVECMEEAVADG